MCKNRNSELCMTTRFVSTTIGNWKDLKEKGLDPDEPEKPLRHGSRCLRDLQMQGASTADSHHGKGNSYYCDKDFYVQLQTVSVLVPGCFYYENITSSDAKLLLKPCAIGVFLVRNSSDPNYLYTLSVRTRLGPTSIRIVYNHGRFSLDSDAKSKRQMPQFHSIMELIDYYVRLTTGKRSDKCRFLDKAGRKDLPIVLQKPRFNSVPGLRHLCRVQINRALDVDSAADVPHVVTQLPLPKPLRSYIKDYPYVY